MTCRNGTMPDFDIRNWQFAGTNAVEEVRHVIVAFVKTLSLFRQRRLDQGLIAGAQCAAIDPDPAVASFKPHAVALAVGVDHSASDCLSGGGLYAMNDTVRMRELDVVFADGCVT